MEKNPPSSKSEPSVNALLPSHGEQIFEAGIVFRELSWGPSLYSDRNIFTFNIVVQNFKKGPILFYSEFFFQIFEAGVVFRELSWGPLFLLIF